MASLWSFRLALYILIDRICKEREDGRYRDLRAYWGGGRRAHLWFLPFFEAQSLLVLLFSLPMLVLVKNTRASISAFEIAGVLVWVVSVVGESIADRQLARFRADPATAGRVCRVGLWRYSRHPNYFFEWLHWWAYVLMGVGAPYGWLTLVGAGGDVAVPAQAHRYSGNREPRAEEPRRGVPRLPAHDEPVRAVASQASLTGGAANVYWDLPFRPPRGGLR
jgi:steroid 5-alpha reductase family enzyme